MGKICVDGTTCQCPPKPPMREGTAWYHTDKRRCDKWETDHGGHVRAAEGRIRGGLRGLEVPFAAVKLCTENEPVVVRMGWC